MTSREISRLRLAAQGLGRPRFDSPAAVVDWMTCMQSQEPRDALLAIALRSGAERLEPVRDAFARGEIVRSWPMRGTLHTVPAGDLGWMLALTAARTLQGASRRRKELGISNRDLDAAVRVAQDTLAPPGLTRSRFVEELDAAGQDATGGRGYHLLFALAQLGVICQGRFEGREQRFVLADAWIASPRALEAEDAVSTWMIRYFRSHGPATVADFRWWTKLLAREVAPVVDEVRRQLEAITVDGEACAPVATVTVTWDDGTVLGTFTADENGDFTTTITIPMDATLGIHLVTATCGDVEQFINVNVLADTVDNVDEGTLARTGSSNTGPLVGIGAAALVLGGAFLYGARRPRQA